MIFKETLLPGVFSIEIEQIRDNRGFFSRTWCAKEFAEHGLASSFVQCNVSYNAKAGTLRGMHYQVAPYEEAKLVSCISGAIYDAVIDIRKGSPTFGQWQAFELTAQNRRMLYVPEGFAHGYQTLTDETNVFYQVSAFYHPESARGIRWNDPSFAIRWPILEPIISDKDRIWGRWSS